MGPVGGDGGAWGGRPGREGSDALEDGSAKAHSRIVVGYDGKVEGEKVGLAASWARNGDFLQHLRLRLFARPVPTVTHSLDSRRDSRLEPRLHSSRTT